MITIQLTDKEATWITYSLRELANRRDEQAIDFKEPHNADEARALRELADDISKKQKTTL